MDNGKILDYLDKIRFKKQLEKLTSKLKNKKVVFYGIGTFFNVINEHFDLSGLDIIGVCDRKFNKSSKASDYLGYNIITFEELNNVNYDYILVSALEYLPILDSLKSSLKNKKVMPLVVRPFREMLIGIFK